MNAPLVTRPLYRPRPHRLNRVEPPPGPRPSIRVFQPETFRSALRVMTQMSDDHLRPKARAMVEAIVEEDLRGAVLFDRIAEVATLPPEEISDFVRSVCDVTHRYYRP